MALIDIAIFIIGGLIYALVVPRRLRGWALLIASVYAIYALQPTLDIRFLDFGLPTATLVIAVYGWILTRPHPLPPSPLGEGERPPDDLPLSTKWRGSWGVRLPDILTLFVVVVTVCALTIPRYIEDFPLEPTSRPPDIAVVLVGLSVALIVGIVLALIVMRRQNTAITIGIIALVALFIVVKTEPFAVALAGFLRQNTGQNVELASMPDIGWLGFSYVAFRILHTLRDRQSGMLPDLSLREYLTFIIFFPAYTSGPIDRAERHLEDDRNLPELRALDPDRLTRAGIRIAVGLFKKFVIADTLALFSLNAVSAAQTDSSAALWFMLYIYAFRLYFDFSGYTDIAIGIGMIYGVQLPENFNNPYAKNTISSFWQSWHMTLSSWARFYIYAPISKILIRRKVPPGTAAGICNAATMIAIGLWHGVTLPFVVWGAWHAAGLTAHKLWSDRTRKWYRGLKAAPRRAQAWQIAGVLLTFHFVLIGWIWFALPDFGLALRTFGGLFGVWR